MRRTSFNDSWEFSRNGEAFAPVVVPHDAMLGNTRSENAPAGSASGFYLGADYQYRKTFTLAGAQAQAPLLLEFGGIYRDAHIVINGVRVDEAQVPAYGFMPFFINVQGLVHEGENLIEVFASNADQPDCRWYSGGGLYRPVWMWEPAGDVVSTGQVGAVLAPQSVRVTTESVVPEAVIRVDVEVSTGTPQVAIISPDGKEIACGSGQHVRFRIPNTHLWSAEHPALYQCAVTLTDATTNKVLDAARVTFGIRHLAWGEQGFLVNGQQTLLRGGCIHCDNGIIGAASFPESEWRRVRLLKQAGFNAVRVAHNPASEALLEACDALGMYVMDETWDMWFIPKNAHDYADHFLHNVDDDLTRLVARDYNHPSVIMYSVGNEIADAVLPEGVAVEQSMVNLLHSLDPTRPVTCGLNLTMMVMERIGRGWYTKGYSLSNDGVSAGTNPSQDTQPRSSLLFNITAQATGTSMAYASTLPGIDKLVSPALDALDIAGYNYGAPRYAIDARKHPKRVIVGSETFPQELARNWRKVQAIPQLIGDFMWAAWDYLGEAGAGAWSYTREEAGFTKPWPWLIAGSGALDILGNPNAAAALAGAVWRTATDPSIQVRPVNIMHAKTYKATWRGTDAIPSWSWRGCAGFPAEVEVYDARAASVRLELNGRAVATMPVRDYVARFRLGYEPGKLTAVALDANGQEIAHSSLCSAEGNLRLDVSPEPLEPVAEPAGLRIAYVPVHICDERGIVESNADERIEVSVQGATLLGFGSARPATTEHFDSAAYTTYRGHALAVIAGAAGSAVTIEARGETLPAVRVDVIL